jgi:hypothetical protein
MARIIDAELEINRLRQLPEFENNRQRQLPE